LTNGVVCALRTEARQLGRTVAKHDSVESLADGTLLAVTGMGYAAAEAGAERLVAAGAAALMSWGLAGGLDPELPAGQIFLPSEIMAPDGALLPTDRLWRERLRATLTGSSPLSFGRLATSPAAVVTVAAKAALFKTSGARAVDMESAAIARVAQKHGLPFVAIRVIVDRATDALPDAVLAASAAGPEVSAWGLLGGLVRSPREVAQVLRLAGAYRQANRSLAAVAARGALLSQQLTHPARGAYTGVS